MKKKALILLLLLTLFLTSCGNTEATPNIASENDFVESTISNTTDKIESQKNTENIEDFSKLEALGDIEVEENLFSVELTIPADYVGEATQEELDVIACENGYKSITLNSNGSATYVMTKSQHEDMMINLSDSINASLSEMVNSETYPSFTEIKANDNFTEFTITTKSTKLDLTESFSVMAFYMYGGMYHIFNGTTVDNISVTFINSDTGEVISTSNSSEMEK